VIDNPFDAIIWSVFIGAGIGYLLATRNSTTDAKPEPCEHEKECADSQAVQAFRYAGLLDGEPVQTVNAILFALKHTEKRVFNYGTNKQLTLDTDNCVCTIKRK
jgi:hypothetical protein